MRKTYPMPASADNLFRRLRSEVPSERLEAARYLAQNALPEHEEQLRSAIARENVVWIKGALRRALARIKSGDELSRSLNLDDAPERFTAQVYAEALETAASQLIHEIEPILGTLRLAAEEEIGNFDGSNTRRHLDRLDELLSAVSRLRRAASAPKVEEFSLDEMVQRCIQETGTPKGIQIQKAGPQSCIVEGDSSLVALSLGNGLRDAIEATIATRNDLTTRPIIVTWGNTDIEYWISVVDLGVGFRGNLQRAFEMRATTGHVRQGGGNWVGV
jgi:hypothetical protein